MEAPDLAIKYKSKVHEAILVINNIRNAGFKNDADELLSELNAIRESTKHKIKNNVIENYETISYEQDYSKGIDALNKFIRKVEREYDVYVKVYNSCKSLNLKLQRNNISVEQLQKYVTEIIYDMKIMIESGTLDYDYEEHIVTILYDTVYNIIKLELMMTGESQVYLYATNRNANINVAYLNNLVLSDINDLDLTDEKNLKLLEKLYELGKNGVTSSYFDLEVIKLILINSDNNSFKQIINTNVEDVIKKINESYEKVKEDIKLQDRANDNMHRSKLNVNGARRALNKRIVSFALALSIITGGAFGTHTLAKLCGNKYTYIKSTSTYQSLDDETTTNEEIVYTLENEDKTKGDKIYIRVYEPWESHYTLSGKQKWSRDYKVYDVSNIETGFEDPKEYYDYGVDNFDVKPSNKTDKDDSSISLYDEPYTVVDIIKYTDNGEVFDQKERIAASIALYTLYVMILFIFGVISDGYGIEKLINRIKKLKMAKEKYNECIKELNEINSRLLLEISKNEELKAKFEELYKENLFLLDNPEELYKRVMDINNLSGLEDAKKLVKNNKKSR